MLFQLHTAQCPLVLSVLLCCSSALAFSEEHGIHARGTQEINLSSHGNLPLHSEVHCSYSMHDAQQINRRQPTENTSAAYPARPQTLHLSTPASSAQIENVDRITNSDSNVAQRFQGHDKELEVRGRVPPPPQADSDRSSETGKQLNAMLAHNVIEKIAVAIDAKDPAYLHEKEIPTTQHPPVAGVAGLALSHRDFEKRNTLYERGPAPVPPVSDSEAPHPRDPIYTEASVSTVVNNVQSTLSQTALQAMVRHCQQSLDKARCLESHIHHCSARAEESKGALFNLKEAYKRNRNDASVSAIAGFCRQQMMATKGISNDMKRLEREKDKLRIETIPGTPANTNANLQVPVVRPRRLDTAFDSLHMLYERGRASMPTRTDSASVSSLHGQNWGSPPPPNSHATAQMALKVMANHYKPLFDSAKAEKSRADISQGEVTQSKDFLSDATYAYHTSYHKTPAEKEFLAREWNRVASEHTADRVIHDMVKAALIAHTRPGTPANTYAKLRVAGVELKKRTEAPSPPNSHSAVAHTPTGTLAPGMLAQDALQIVAEYAQAGIPAAQSQRNRATEAFEKSQEELDGAAKAWKKPFIEAMYHSQQHGLEMNREYRDNNKDQHRANQHLRNLHETIAKLRDTGISPQIIGIRPRSPADSGAAQSNVKPHILAREALGIIAQHSQRRLDDAQSEHAKAMAIVARTGARIAAHHNADTLNTLLGLELRRQQRANDLAHAHMQNQWLELYHEKTGPARTLVGLRTAVKGVDNKSANLHAHRKRSPTRSQTRRQKMKAALEVVANHSHERIKAVREKQAQKNNDVQRVADIVEKIPTPWDKPSSENMIVMSLYKQRREKASQTCREFYELFEQGGPVRTLQKLRAACREVRAKFPNGVMVRE